MSSLPATNGEEASRWMSRARAQAEPAGFAADRQYWHEACHDLVRAAELAIKAAHIANDTPVPRGHHIRQLLATCPMPAIGEKVYREYDRNSLNRFSQYYFSVYPDGEDADPGTYIWCSQIMELIMRNVEENLP